MKSCTTMSWRTRFTVNAIACIVAAFAWYGVAPAQTARPGANAIATVALGELPQTLLYWHLDTYPTRAAAEATKGARGTVVESFDKVWLFTIAEADWRPSGGDRVARIGPVRKACDTRERSTIFPVRRSRTHSRCAKTGRS